MLTISVLTIGWSLVQGILKRIVFELLPNPNRPECLTGDSRSRRTEEKGNKKEKKEEDISTLPLRDHRTHGSVVYLNGVLLNSSCERTIHVRIRFIASEGLSTKTFQTVPVACKEMFYDEIPFVCVSDREWGGRGEEEDWPENQSVM
jgi:hypothetical protein